MTAVGNLCWRRRCCCLRRSLFSKSPIQSFRWLVLSTIRRVVVFLWTFLHTSHNTDTTITANWGNIDCQGFPWALGHEFKARSTQIATSNNHYMASLWLVWLSKKVVQESFCWAYISPLAFSLTFETRALHELTNCSHNRATNGAKLSARLSFEIKHCLLILKKDKSCGHSDPDPSKNRPTVSLVFIESVQRTAELQWRSTKDRYQVKQARLLKGKNLAYQALFSEYSLWTFK